MNLRIVRFAHRRARCPASISHPATASTNGRRSAHVHQRSGCRGQRRGIQQVAGDPARRGRPAVGRAAGVDEVEPQRRRRPRRARRARRGRTRHPACAPSTAGGTPWHRRRGACASAIAYSGTTPDPPAMSCTGRGVARLRAGSRRRTHRAGRAARACRRRCRSCTRNGETSPSGSSSTARTTCVLSPAEAIEYDRVAW